jgi:hypothetical protein
MLQKLRKERVVPYKNLDEAMKARFCSPPSVGCVDGSCTSCKLNKLSTDEDNVDLDKIGIMATMDAEEDRFVSC